MASFVFSTTAESFSDPLACFQTAEPTVAVGTGGGEGSARVPSPKGGATRRSTYLQSSPEWDADVGVEAWMCALDQSPHCIESLCRRGCCPFRLIYGLASTFYRMTVVFDFFIVVVQSSDWACESTAGVILLLFRYLRLT